jgi:hypothetical protein
MKIMTVVVAVTAVEMAVEITVEITGVGAIMTTAHMS